MRKISGVEGGGIRMTRPGPGKPNPCLSGSHLTRAFAAIGLVLAFARDRHDVNK
jgi:hypothetical protein